MGGPDAVLIPDGGGRRLVALTGPPGAEAAPVDGEPPTWQAYGQARLAAADAYGARGATERAYVALVCARDAFERAGDEDYVVAAQAALARTEPKLDELAQRSRPDEPAALAERIADPDERAVLLALAAGELPLRGAEWRRLARAWLGEDAGIPESAPLARARRREFRASAALAWRLARMRMAVVPSWEARDAAEVYRESLAVYSGGGHAEAVARVEGRLAHCEAWDEAYRAATHEAHAAAEAYEQASNTEDGVDEALARWIDEMRRVHADADLADPGAWALDWLGRLRQLVTPEVSALLAALGGDAEALLVASAAEAGVRTVDPEPAPPVTDPVGRVRPDVATPRIHGLMAAATRERAPRPDEAAREPARSERFARLELPEDEGSSE